MLVGIPKETFRGERRVALVPASLPPLAKAGLQVLLEPGAGAEAGFPDADYEERGGTVAADRDAVFAQADIIVQVRGLGANPEAGRADLDRMRSGQVLIGSTDPLGAPEAAKDEAARGVTSFALELVPRITRAQSMDILSSMATIAGYKAVLLAADALPKMFPMMMTAAGTVTAAKAFIMGAGVAGLQAIASARRMGAVVEAYDVRPVVKEQVESLGAKFVEVDLETGGAEDKGGYAKEQSDEFLQKQRELMAKVIAESDVVITTAAIPGRRAPILVTAEMARGMRPGSVIVDLAAERGGNCELTTPGESVRVNGVTIIGPLNLPATVPFHASQMFAKNMSTYLLNLMKDGDLHIDLDDEIIRDTLVTRDGDVVNARIRELLELEPLTSPEPEPETTDDDSADGNDDESADDSADDSSEEDA